MDQLDRGERGGVGKSSSSQPQTATSSPATQGVAGPGVSSISLPKGGGAVRGIGEKFAANPVTGTGSLSIPVATSPGRSGFGPQLALSYDSGSGNGVFGFGWSMGQAAITRKTDKGLPQYQDAEETDVFMLSGAEDLVPVLDPAGSRHGDTATDPDYLIHRYRPRIEGLFARIERWTRKSDGDAHWRSISGDNVLTIYGKDAESRIADPEDRARIFSWLICETRDDKGNVALYGYEAENGTGVDVSHAHEANRGGANDPRRTANRYLKRIRYGNRLPLLNDAGHRPRFLSDLPDTQVLDAGWMFELVFDYGEHDVDAPTPNGPGPWQFRADPFSSYRAGFEVRTTRVCSRVLMFHHFEGEDGVGANCLVASTDIRYSHQQAPDDARNPIHSFVRAVTHSRYQRDGGGYLKRSLPAVEFEYTEPVVQDRVEEVDLASLQNLPVGVDGTAYRWTDLHGEGIPGILTEQANAWFYKRNLSPIANQGVEFAPLERVASQPNLALAAGAQFMDLAGNGKPDLVVLDGPAPGFYEHDGDEGWQPFRPLTSRLTRAMGDPQLRFVDLTGDGHADVLISEDSAFVWHASLAEAGFGPARRVAQAMDEEIGPRLVFADGTQSIYLADMSGDRLIDLVRIRNGLVCYWPNLGYGRFGAKVTMDNAPWFEAPGLFDQRRIRLADVDGSGITDILYLQHDRVAIYFNQAGNGWAAAQFIDHLPSVDNLSDVTVTDLLGNGTACLVWSSPLPANKRRPMRYVNLMGGQKPHLLIGTINNLGAETRVQYAPSTKFYLQDKYEGNPWISRLPFPVHVVESVETFDHISRNRFVSRYTYHHGHFDGIEREFRGFGMVEQIDTEEFATLNQSDAFPTGDNIDEASHVPPVLTRSWFHTGIYPDQEHVSNFFAGFLDESDMGEYYREPGLNDEQAARLLLPDTILPEDLTADEEREAIRALKGAMLRQEVYALDGTEQQANPYTVSEQNFTIQVLQRRGENRHAVFFTHAREALNYHYERNPADPRITHSLTLAVDDYGNVLRSASIGYGRRQADPILHPADQTRQSQLLMTCAENAFTNPVEDDDQYRTPLPCETRSYELTGLSLDSDQVRFRFGQMAEAVETAQRIDYHQTPDGGLQRRVIEHARTLYRRDELSGALPLGVVESMALPFESYQLAFTPEHLELVFGDRVTETMLGDEGRYVPFDGDGNWWIPSGRVFLSSDEVDGAAQELAFARQHFFMPQRFRDQFGETTTVRYDAHDLLLIRTTDSLENSVTSSHDYRLLAPERMTDPNGNRSTVAFDVLGMVAGTAVMGKTSENVGDSLDGFTAQLTQDQIDAFFADPRGPIANELLGNATSRIVYDETRFQRLGLPGFAASIVRETHVSDLGAGEVTPVQISLAYSDGFGRAIQSKVAAEPGPVEADGLDVEPRWTTSGWTIFNNKGKPVRQYEPFFSSDHEFEFGVEVGVSPTLFYDPVGRVVATLHSNHTWDKVIFNPWRQESWDVNDTVLAPDPAGDLDVGDYFERLDADEYLPTWHQARIDGDLGLPEQDAAQKADAHANTPAVVHFDSLGRPFLSIADNGPEGRVRTRTEEDIEGNPLRVIDDRDNVVMAYQLEIDGNPPVLGYDLAGRQLYETSMDAGERWGLVDIAGQPIRSWDSRGHVFRMEYDALRRPTRSFVTGADEEDADREIVFQRTIYGEDQGDAFNHRSRVFQVFDGAGVVTSVAYDFKGNLLHGSRQLTVNYREPVDWSLDPVLEIEVFSTRTIYDALNRPVEFTSPDESVTLPTYNEANLLEQMAVRIRGASQATPFVTNIDYNARGQREQITFATADGTNFRTTYDYDSNTFRLNRLHTVRHLDTRDLQDLRYAFDPVGNITSIRDQSQQVVFFSNNQIDPHNDYTYDALYRLTRAEGREHAAQNNLQRDADDFDPVIGVPFPNSPEALQRYLENYTYDGVGNILGMQHRGGGVQRWNRRYQYAVDSNRLLGTSRPGDTADQFSGSYDYDTHGNMTAMPHLPMMRWDFKDQLQASSRQVVNNGGTPETTYYVYDAAGERVRKVTERQSGVDRTPARRNERIYLRGVEIYREYANDGATVTLERETLNVMDDQQRIAQVDTRTEGIDESPAQSLRFQMSNHLGSATLEVDDQANVISYEEYHPYGTSAYRSGRSAAEMSLKRYRYTGKERDEETGLSYHGARYYTCWLGRWTAADPIRMAGGMNLYQYTRDNPVMLTDNGGTAPEDPGNPKGPVQLELRFGVKKGKPKVEAKAGGSSGDTLFRRSKRVMVGKKADAARGVLSVLLNAGSAQDIEAHKPIDPPAGDETPELENDEQPGAPGRKRKAAGAAPPPKSRPKQIELSFGAAGADPNLDIEAPRPKEASGGTATRGKFGGFTDIKPLPHPNRNPPPALTPPSQTTSTPPSVLVSPPLADIPPLAVDPPDSIGQRVLRALDDVSGFSKTKGSLGRAFGKLSARYLIPFADEAMEAWETIGGASGASYLGLRASTALRAGAAAAGRGIAVIGSAAGLVLASAAVGVGLGLVLDHFFDFSGKLADWFSDVTGMTQWLESLDALNGGRRTVR